MSQAVKKVIVVHRTRTVNKFVEAYLTNYICLNRSWQVGDVVSVLLSWDGVVSFWLNGKDLGPALKNKLNTSKLWYPAASLSIDQQCTFIFDEANMRYVQRAYQ